MRPTSAVFLLLAAASALTGCTGSGSAHRNQSAGMVSTQSVRCNQVIEQTGPPGPRIVFGTVAVPPVYLGRAEATSSRQWPYFRKYGIVIRADSPAVLVTVPKRRRHRVAISWGSNVGIVSSLRFP